MFDFFGVINSEIAPYMFAKHTEPSRAATLKDEVFVPADLGEVSLDQVFDQLSELFGISRAEVVEEWNSHICINTELVAYIRRLRNIADVVLVSNAPHGLVEGIVKQFGLDDLFDKTFISCNLHLVKPNPAIYKYCLESMGKCYDEVYMIDDNPANLAPLTALGVTPVRYTSIRDVYDVFDKLL